MPLGELARDGRLAVAERGLRHREEGREPARRLEEDERARLAGERREASGARARPRRQEALEYEPLGGKARHRDERGQGRRAGHRHDRHAGGERATDQMVARIGDSRRARVGDERHRRAGLEPRDEGRRPLALDGVVVAGERARDAVALEERARAARVLGGDEIDLAEDAQRPQGHVLQVADRGGDDVEGPGRHRTSTLSR